MTATVRIPTREELVPVMAHYKASTSDDDLCPFGSCFSACDPLRLARAVIALTERNAEQAAEIERLREERRLVYEQNEKLHGRVMSVENSWKLQDDCNYNLRAENERLAAILTGIKNIVRSEQVNRCPWCGGWRGAPALRNCASPSAHDHDVTRLLMVATGFCTSDGLELPNTGAPNAD